MRFGNVTKHLTTSLFTFLLAISVYAQKDAKATSDSLSRDSLVLGLPASPDALDEEVIYSAEDSMRFDLAEKKIYLYGKADVKYDKIHLQAAYIEINWSTNVIHAEGQPDSTGKMSGTPQFSEGEQTFDASKMDYNFKTKKGKISEIYTKQGEGYLLGNA